MRFDVITLFPELIESFAGHGVIGKAVDSGTLSIAAHQLRNHCEGSIHAVDDAPYGGGPGMVMRPEPIFAAVEAIGKDCSPARKILLTPQGARFDQATAERYAEQPSLLLFCGRYEGVDERVRGLFDEELSLGDFILSGAEAAAVAVIDAVGRLVPGVLGSGESTVQESFSGSEGRRILEYPQYTRPEEFRGMRVPAVLTSGNHARIDKWRHEQALERTRARRPDLLSGRADKS